MDSIVQNALEKFFAQFKTVRYIPDEIILRQDDVPQGIEFIQSGHVRMYRVFEDGTELTLNIFRPGAFFPMVWAICDLPNLYYFRALTATTTKRSSKNEVIAFVKQNPPLLYDLTQRMLTGYYGLLLHTEKLLIGSASQKVASVLVMLTQRFGKKVDGEKVKITLGFSHQEIADCAHLSRETTSLEMKKLRDQGLIEYLRRQIVIVDLEQLKKRLLADEYMEIQNTTY